MREKIRLYTKSGELVHELDFEHNLGIYLMMERGTAPNAVQWGLRFFIQSRDNMNNYFEEFCMSVF